MKLVKLGLAAVGLAIAAGAIAFGASMFAGGSAQAAPGGNGRSGEYQQILAQKLGISLQQLQAAQTAARNQTIDNAVAAGKLTPDQATKLKNHQGGFGFNGSNGGKSGHHHQRGPQTTPPPGSTTTQ